MVAADATFLSLMLHPKAHPPLDPTTGKMVERLADRIEKLLEDLDSEGERIIVPTPALCEFLVLAGPEGPAYLDKLAGLRPIIVRPFDQLAAIELAAMEVDARTTGDKRAHVSQPWTKVKFDRQIVAIAKVNSATRIYSDDRDVRAFGTKAGLEVTCSWELPLPPAKQTDLFDGHS
jgi:predicted nucleic acid-binding protein